MEYFTAATSLIQCFCGPDQLHRSVSKQCSYLAKPRVILRRLDEQTNFLSAQETDIRHMINVGEVLHDMEPKAEVKLWLENVKKFRDSVNQMKEHYAEDKKCLSFFPNCHYRLKLGNVVDQKLLEIDKLLEHSGKISGNLLVDKLPGRRTTLPGTRLMGETSERNLKRIWDHLMDESIGTIGIYGMGGVGKTTIMVEINNRLVRANAYFDSIIWVTGSRECNLKKLQNDIAMAIGLDFNNVDDEMTRATKLYQALLRQNRFLLIIDDLWEAFSLETVGIPNPDEFNLCKLVITTRSFNVCRGMETKKEVEIQVLSAEEAWDLFKEKVGQDLTWSPSIEAVARDVAKECGGLPLAIGTIGRALRKETNRRQWQIALRELRNSTASLEGMENQVFARLRFSYEKLRNDTTRSCFLYCALYPEDHHIETQELMRYWIYEGLLGSLGDMESKMQQGYIILDELKNACMLECVPQDGTTDEHVKMHDLIRDMAIALTRVKPLFLVRAGYGIGIPPVQEEWLPDLERVSLMRNDLSCLVGEPRCPCLNTLLLQYNSISKGIDSHFFNHMINLSVLDLSYTGINALPDSLSRLCNLRALLLCSCWSLSYIPTLANLKELRVLDLSYSSIECMPQGMEMLVNLRHLDLSYCKANGSLIHLLPNYKVLENLLLIREWQLFDLGFVEAVISCINLSQLEVNFSSFDDFNQYVFSGNWNQLENFKFCIGYPQSSMNLGKSSVELFGVSIPQFSNPWLPGRIVELDLHGCSGITHLLEFITIASSQLRRCKIQYCDEMEWIITEWCTFPDLEWFKVTGLRKLNSLCKGIPEEGTLTNLKVFHLSACSNLRTLFSLQLVHNLINLQELIIENCRKMKEIIAVGLDDEDWTEVVLPRLQKLRLRSLPKLTRICSTKMTCDFLSTL